MNNTEENVEYLKGILIQQEATIKRMEELHTNDEIEIQNLKSQYNLKSIECDQLKIELSIEKSINQVHHDYMDAFSKKGPLVSLNVSGHVDINKDDQDMGKIDLPVIPHETPAPIVAPPIKTETFFDRVKCIVRQAATKNGQTIRCRAKGHISLYTFFINSDCLCRAVDEMVDKELERIREFLGGNLYNVQLSKVCYFIGHIVRMNIINDVSLQMNDILFAFEPYYTNKASLHSKLCDKTTTPSMNVFMGIFEGLLRRYSS